MGMRICYIVGAGERPQKLEFPNKGFLIAADGGYSYLMEEGFVPDLVLGDFDSLGYVPDHPNLLKTPAEKDDTDMLLAIKKGMELQYRKFCLYGCLGGRLDHSLANLQSLHYLSINGMSGLMIGVKENILVVHNGSVSFRDCAKGYVSVFSLDSESTGIRIEGLKYSVRDAVLRNHFPIGVSNEFTGERATISVEDGTLAVLFGGIPWETLDDWF